MNFEQFCNNGTPGLSCGAIGLPVLKTFPAQKKEKGDFTQSRKISKEAK